MARILVIEDEQDLGSLLEYNLKADGHTPVVARTGSAGVLEARAEEPDLVLLDLMLPDISGTEVARMLRDLHPTVPIVMVTARGEEADRVRGLEIGADDYVVKPFSVKELLLRIRAVLRRGDGPQAPASPATAAGPATAAPALRPAPGAPSSDPSPLVDERHGIVLDIVRHEVRVGGALVTLTALEFRLLRLFLERPGRIQSRETLLADVWSITADVTTRTVDTHIKRLREKLGAAGSAIETVRGVGYKLVG